MKKLIVTLILFLSISCHTNNSYIIISEIPSKKMVTLSPNFKKPGKDSICLNIPLQIKIENKKKENVDFVNLKLKMNNELLEQIKDYLVYDKKHNIIYSTEEETDLKKNLYITIIQKDYLISLEEAKELLSLYKINKPLNELKVGDTIKIASYKEFRNKSPHLIEMLRDVGDTLILSTSHKGIKGFDMIRYEIQW